MKNFTVRVMQIQREGGELRMSKKKRKGSAGHGGDRLIVT